MNNDEDCDVEKYYVYKELNTGKWNAVLSGVSTDFLPTISFGTRIFAFNEKDAIGRAKKTYDEIHAYDSDKDNIRRFAASGFKAVLDKYGPEKYPDNDDLDLISDITVGAAIRLNKKYIEHFKELEKDKK